MFECEMIYHFWIVASAGRIIWLLIESWQVAEEGIPLPSDKSLCPLCSQKRVSPSVLAASGFVFCYTCICKYITQVCWCLKSLFSPMLALCIHATVCIVIDTLSLLCSWTNSTNVALSRWFRQQSSRSGGSSMIFEVLCSWIFPASLYLIINPMPLKQWWHHYHLVGMCIVFSSYNEQQLPPCNGSLGGCLPWKLS